MEEVKMPIIDINGSNIDRYVMYLVTIFYRFLTEYPDDNEISIHQMGYFSYQPLSTKENIGWYNRINGILRLNYNNYYEKFKKFLSKNNKCGDIKIYLSDCSRELFQLKCLFPYYIISPNMYDQHNGYSFKMEWENNNTKHISIQIDISALKELMKLSDISYECFERQRISKVSYDDIQYFETLMCAIDEKSQIEASGISIHGMNYLLSLLQEEDSEVLKLRYMSRLSINKIAVKLGHPSGCVEYSICRSLKYLRDNIGYVRYGYNTYTNMRYDYFISCRMEELKNVVCFQNEWNDNAYINLSESITSLDITTRTKNTLLRIFGDDITIGQMSFIINTDDEWYCGRNGIGTTTLKTLEKMLKPISKTPPDLLYDIFGIKTSLKDYADNKLIDINFSEKTQRVFKNKKLVTIGDVVRYINGIEDWDARLCSWDNNVKEDIESKLKSLGVI